MDNCNNAEKKKTDRRKYMRDYMRQRNVKIRGDPRTILTDDQKKEKVKSNNRKYYINNREKALEYARQKREINTGMTRMDRIIKIFKILTPQEKEKVKML